MTDIHKVTFHTSKINCFSSPLMTYKSPQLALDPPYPLGNQRNRGIIFRLNNNKQTRRDRQQNITNIIALSKTSNKNHNTITLNNITNKTNVGIIISIIKINIKLKLLLKTWITLYTFNITIKRIPYTFYVRMANCSRLLSFPRWPTI